MRQQWLFPLREIGPLYTQREQLPPEDISPLGPPELGDPLYNSVLHVLEERRGDTPLESIMLLGQPSRSDDSRESVQSNMTSHYSVYTLSPADLRNLIERAEHWLLWYTPDNRDLPLSPTIYWTIRSLRSLAEFTSRNGASRSVYSEEEEWPDPPQGEDNYDMTVLPTWLSAFLTLNNLLAWGLRGRRNAPERRRRQALQFHVSLALPVAEIPQRELDDPPDWRVRGWGDSDGDSESSSFNGLIEELSNTQIEDITSG